MARMAKAEEMSCAKSGDCIEQSVWWRLLDLRRWACRMLMRGSSMANYWEIAKLFVKGFLKREAADTTTVSTRRFFSPGDTEELRYRI